MALRFDPSLKKTLHSPIDDVELMTSCKPRSTPIRWLIIGTSNLILAAAARLHKDEWVSHSTNTH